MTEEIKPVELKVTLYTNIPSGNDYENDVLTFATLSSEALKEVKIKPTAYPFFSFQIKYDESIISSLSYADVVKTFFDKEEFLNKFGNAADAIPLKEENQTSEYYKKRTENINNNVMIMIRYLLPTKYPVVNNHFNSYDLFRGKDPMHTLFFNPVSSGNYVYLKLSSGTYTMKKLVWLNDFLNHPEYKKAFEENATELKIKSGRSSNKLLQDDLDGKQQDLEKIKLCYSGKCESKNRDLAYVGMQLSDNDSYEIVVDVELFENQLKTGEESKINCAYTGDYLGEELTRLLREGRRKKKPLNGRIVKMPLFSIASMTSRKQGDIDKEELDKDKKEKRKKEDLEYNDIERDLRNNYEAVINVFFDNMNKGALKTRIKKYDINKKNYYTFLEENLEKLFRYIILSDADKKDPVKGQLDIDRINRLISDKMDVFTTEKNRKRLSKDDYDKLKINFDIAKELVTYVKDKYKPPEQQSTGGTRKKRINKKKYTRKQY